MTTNTNILKKLSAIMAEAEYIQKDAKNAHGGYKYASEKAIKETLHPILAKHGVVFQLNCTAPVVLADTKTQYLPVEYVFWDSESGESLSGNFVGSAHTRDEKAHYAAITGAIKYILTSTFLIPTGDDPENDKNEAKKGETNKMVSGSVTAQQWDYITKLRVSVEIPEKDDADLTAWASGTGQTEGEASKWIDYLKELPKKFDRAKVIAWIEKKEPVAYKKVLAFNKDAITEARLKYATVTNLTEATDDLLRVYAEHLKERK